MGTVADREKMPFEVTPFVIYLTRVGAENPKTSELRCLAPEISSCHLAAVAVFRSGV